MGNHLLIIQVELQRQDCISVIIEENRLRTVDENEVDEELEDKKPDCSHPAEA